MSQNTWSSPEFNGARDSTRELRAALFREATSIIDTELASPLTGRGIARRVATSPRQLRRVFAEVGGTSFRSYLNQVRMSRAAELLDSSELPVAEIARRVGYSQPGQFSKAFKRANSTTPSEFRHARRHG